MALRQVPNTDVRYHLLSFDARGAERPDLGGSLGSEAVIEAVPADLVTDVFIASHGWKGDVPAAIEQYDVWTRRMASQPDLATVRARRPDFRPLVVGLHWPSLPWGDENLPMHEAGPGLLGGDDDAESDEFASENAMSLDRLVELYAARTADTPAARAALLTILQADPEATGDVLPPDVEQAYQVLFAESTLGSDGAVGAPGDDQEGFDPRTIINEAGDENDDWPAAQGPGLLGAARLWSPVDLLRLPLRQLSFWTMKRRARTFGESGAHRLLRRLQLTSPQLRIHLMGHSFGCIVVSGAVAGPPGGNGLPRPVQTLFLVQGAMSLWSFAEDVPSQPGATGFYHGVLAGELVDGPIITTRSVHDTAVGVFYPRGAELGGQLLLDEEYPAFGGLGAFGAQGVGAAQDGPVLDASAFYDFEPGALWNLDANHVIVNGSGPSGAHSDIDHDELAHAFWQAALVTITR